MIRVYIAGLFCLAAGVGSLLRFVGVVDEQPLLVGTISLVKMAPIVYALYIFTNQIAAHNRPPAAAGIDFMFSLLAAVPLTFVAWHVWKNSPVTSIQQFFDLPIDVLMLFVATIYSWVDISYNQIEGWRQAIAGLGSAIFAGLLVVSIILLLFFLFGTEFPKMKDKIFAPSPVTTPRDHVVCEGRHEFTGYSVDGKKLFICE